ncbi:non-ribosomal peptide synthetase [Flavobacterium aquidurense]|uniref:Amino acid adenylation domain protein n=1 Tax=Flavobacterium aquidurense TaxID=362413 RepID=A0A0Q1BKN3_9FLAO|nr:non-ribosomal peptide synthetase [Flavobacterium aquidurense]KQB41366.1 Amino acid adenylation domain protein [Flavobacterium aquidurense]
MDTNKQLNKNSLISKYWKKKTLGKEQFYGSDQVEVSLKTVLIDVQEIDYFNKITNNNTVAQYTVINAVYSFLLKRLMNSFDGDIASNYEKTNPLFFSFSTDLKVSFKEYLHGVKNEILETLEHSDYDVKEVNDLNKFSNYTINFNSNTALKCNGIVLNIAINELGTIAINASYLEGFVNNNVVEYLVQHVRSFIVNLENNINVILSGYPLLSEKEKHQILVDFNLSERVFPDKKTIVDLFEDQVLKTPKNTAIIFNGKELSYSELNEKANQLANYISSHYKVNKGDVIGVFLPKSDFGIISLLAILKLGAVYLPIDTNYPLERINYLIKDSGLNLLINAGIDNVKIDNCNIISISSIELEENNSDSINTVISPKDLAYIIYTSGSTGQPKGVMVEHQGTINMFLDQIRTFEITENDKIVWFASVSFDASVSEILMALNSGAALSIPTEDEIKDRDLFVAFLKETHSTVVTFPPSYLGLLSNDAISGLRCIITAGESANPSAALSITDLGIDYYNAYGPTECTVCVSIYKVTKDDFSKSIIPIGKPIANTKIYILDEQLQTLPIGASGKIYVSGAGLARGYLNKTDLTNEKFVANPFSEQQKMYDTGDLGSWLPDGTIEYLGRKDQQVKLRGFRIELGEIENAILQYSKDIKQAVVKVIEHNHEKVLVAYLVSASIVDKSDLRSFLQNTLPDYMVPGFYVPLEKLPLTPNGKIDRKALPELSGNDSIRKQYVAPRNTTEEIVAEIWQEVLNIQKIGIHDDFFELGGHSLIVGQVINRINQQLGKTVSFKTFFSNATVEKVTANLKDSNYLPIPKTPKSPSYPVTASQNRLWILSQLEGGSLAYNMPAAVNLKGDLDINKFEESFKILINRHEILRTYFKTNEEGEVRQYVSPLNQVEFKMVQQDYSVVKNQEDAVTNYLAERNKEIFDLENGPLLHASLLKVRRDEYVFFLSLHHIIGDGWTIELIIAEIVKTYNALKQGNQVDLSPLKIQYKDYALWFNEELQQEKNKVSENYWLNQFSGEIPVLDLPGFKTRPLVQTYNGDTLRHTFSKEFLDKLKNFSQQHDLTLFMTLMSGINSLLYRYTGQDDIITGTPIAGREHPDLENQLGLFLNTLAIRAQIKEQSTFFDIVSNQKETLLQAYDHQNYPFDLLVNKLNLKRDTSRSALFDVLVVLQNQSQLKNINTEALSDIAISDFDFNDKTAQVDISFRFTETDALHLAIEYNTDIYEGYLIEKMFAHFENLLIQLIENPVTAIEKIDFLTESEKQRLLFDFNDTDIVYEKDKTILDLFEEQAAKTPDNIAVIFDSTKITYRELNEQSNQLAAYLIKNYAIESNDLVGIKLDRSERMIVAIFGILKSGGAYVPIDVSYPQERIDYIAKDANLKLCIDENELDKFRLNQDFYATTPIQLSNLNHLAYCIYTSGSTGKPKGVLNHHAGLYNRLVWMKSYLKVDDKQNFLQKTPYTFDVSVWELILPFITGSTLVIAKPDGHKDVIYLEQIIDKERVTIIHFVPSMLGAFLENAQKGNCNSLLHVVCSGEELPVLTAQDCKNKFLNAALHNLYGPTEAAIDVTAVNLSEIDVVKDGVTIGKPIANTKIYIVNNALELQPFGVPGELLISGIQVARGYLNLPELTEDRFIADPFRAGYHVYRTGDVAQWQPDGSIGYLGRIDNQVKIRGNRIELGEVESTIIEYGTIQQVVVMAKELNSEKVLVAYVVSENDLDKTALRNFLQNRLPDYMIPGFYIKIAQFPLTSSGKIDRKVLPAISSDDIVRKAYVAPQNEIEKELVLIWENVLGLKNIGVTDNFFELGGHSLIVSQVINRTYKQLGKTLSFKTFFTNPTIQGIANQLIENEYAPISKAAQNESYPLSASQSRLWVLSQLEGGSLAYNMPAAVVLKGDIDASKFEESFKILINRHEILRTSFKINEQDEVRQFIINEDDITFKIEQKDFSLVPNKDHEVKKYLKAEINKPFNLEDFPLIRASLLQVEEQQFIFFLSLHHIIGDGWSIEIIIAEIIQIYNALLQGKEIGLPVLEIQYKDYAVWFTSELEQEKFQLSEQYWLQEFQGELPVIDLPNFKTRPLIQTYNGNHITHQFPASFLERLQVFSNQHDVTLFMTLMAGINALLHRYTGQYDLIVGTPIAGREHPDLENQIGLYLNTLAIRTQLNEQASFLDVLEIQKIKLLGAYDHQNYPFDALVNQLNLKRDTSRSALFDVLVVLQNQEQLRNINTEELSGMEISDYEFKSEVSQLDLSFTFIENKTLNLTIEYNRDIYDDYLAERIFVHFENLLTKLIDNPKALIQEADYLAADEKQNLLVDFNSTEIIYPKDKTIVDLFEEQVQITPDTIAVIFEKTTLTYQQLNEKSNQLAHYLRANFEIASDDLIAIKLDRSERMIITILAILKAGAAYVPIDINYPQERIDYIESDSNCKDVIDETRLDQFEEIKENYPKTNIGKINQPHDLAYVIYTSGTTGNPKGVMVEHFSVVSICENWKIHYALNQIEVNLLQLASISFDVFVGDICRSILTGGKMIICSNDVKLNPEHLYELMQEQKISILEGTPSLLLPLMDYISSENKDYSFFKILIFGSDSFNNQDYNALKDKFGSAIKIINSYGVTEATIDSTYYDDYKKDLNGFTPIGRPFSNTKIIILDSFGNLVPSGVYGEVYIGGEGLARGYFNNPDLTAQKFVTSLFEGTEKLYKTGDLGRWFPDGNIDFIGRKDNQVKIRGYRIELGEVENALQQKNDIDSCVVLARNNALGEKYLVAYVVSKEEQKVFDLITHLQHILPNYMVPSYFVQIEAIPLTPNGKIDRNSLPSPKDSRISSGTDYVAPESDSEKVLVKIWQQVLGLEKIGIKDDFFELGGHSLTVTKLLNQINREFEVKISFSEIFSNTILENQLQVIIKAKKSSYQSIGKAPEQSEYPLSSSQRRLWLLSQFEGGNAAYNMPSIFEIKGDFTISHLQKAFNDLIDRHESLRTVFKEGEDDVKQIVMKADEVNFQLQYEDISTAESPLESLNAIIKNEIAYTFDLSSDLLIRSKIVQTSPENYTLICVMHHIISDGWSLEVITNELFALYDAIKKGSQHILPELKLQYKDFAVWQQDQLKSEAINAHKSYWLEKFNTEVPVLNLPTYQVRPTIKTYEGKSRSKSYDQELLKNFNTLCMSQGTTLFMGLLAAVNTLLYKYTDLVDIIIGTPIAGREDDELQNQIGLFVNTLALRTQFDAKYNFKELLANVKQVTLGAYEHQIYPFDEIVEQLPLKRDMSRNPLFDVMVAFQNTDNLKVDLNELGDFSIEEYKAAQNDISKFDLEFIFEETVKGIDLVLIYNTDLYTEEFVNNILHHFEVLLKSIVSEPGCAISLLDYLKEGELRTLLVNFNDTNVAYPKTKTILDLFETQAQTVPQKEALKDDLISYTYDELNQLSNRIAQYITFNYGELNQSPIAVLLDRSAPMVALLLGILKSGRAYIPLDPHFPKDRLSYIIANSEVEMIITENKYNIEQPEGITVLTLDTVINGITGLLGDQLKTISPDDTAYIIYTSGSTGNPKGVEIGHRSLLNFLTSIQNKPGVGGTDLLFSVTTYSFDISILEFFVPLICGAALYIASNEVLQDSNLIIQRLEELKPTIIQATPSFYQMLFNADWSGADNLKVLCGGDLLSEALAEKMISSCMEVWNMYGPTETTIWSSIKRILYKKEASNIGKPINNTEFYILDQFLRPKPAGTVGAIYIGGDGLAKGYYKNQELTQAKFIKNPFSETGLIYETGDVGKWNAKGEIEFLGRNDNQVKIRGYRIELGEIENALLKITSIDAAVVMVKVDANGNQVLVSYLISKLDLNGLNIKLHLKEFLPDYMIPAFYIQLENMPLTPNGKIDRISLPSPQNMELISIVDYIPARNETEAKLIKIWTEVLGIQKVGVKDNFFELGGNSLNATRLIGLILKQFELKISITDLFKNSVLEEQAALLDTIHLSAVVSFSPYEDDADVEIFSI